MATIREVPFSELTLDRAIIYQIMGQDGYVPDDEMTARVEGMIAHIATFARPMYAYRLCKAGAIDRNSVTVCDVNFRIGSVIAPYFAQSESVTVFVATTGVEFGEWLHGIKAGGDILEEFVADAIGSAFAEAVAERVAVDLAAEQEALGMRISNSYSPGYCGWNVTTQRDLFSLLPPKPCGITLSDSCLMNPIKSVSGFISVGHAVEKQPYGCEICDKINCFRNKNKRRKAADAWPCSPEA